MNTDRMKAAFNLFDQDGDGYITSDQLKNIFKTLGKAADDSDLKTLIGGNVEGMFTARDGKIDYDTFVSIYNGDIKQEPITDLQEAFKLLDKEGNGHIEAAELRYICRRLGEDLTVEEVEEMVSEALIGFEGKIFYDGLLKILITQ